MALLRAEADAGSLVVAVLHDLTMAARYCDRLLLMDNGRLVGDGAPVAVLDAERLRRVYGVEAMIDANGQAPLIVPTGRSRPGD
jgi:iron complex transport system ATP-binding protein